jgi:hypothetical protein
MPMLNADHRLLAPPPPRRSRADEVQHPHRAALHDRPAHHDPRPVLVHRQGPERDPVPQQRPEADRQRRRLPLELGLQLHRRGRLRRRIAQPAGRAGAAGQREGALRADLWITSTDHKVIGYMYLITSFAFFLIAA